MSERPEGAIGIDLGASRIKVASRTSDGATRFESFAAAERPAVSARAQAAQGAAIGLTGAGATAFAEALDARHQTRVVGEFDAWARGSRCLLESAETGVSPPFLLVSLGTGTSMLHVESAGATRLGGTALGGGTLTGLAARLCDCRDFGELCRLAENGDRRSVDLVLADLYTGDRPLPGSTTASALEKLGRPPAAGAREPRREDIAAALMGLVGENVAILASALAAAADLATIVYGGSTLRENPALTNLLVAIPASQGRRGLLLPSGEYAGAVGALEAAAG